MDCLCYCRRNKKTTLVQKNQRNEMVKMSTSKDCVLEICCNYILCEKKVESGCGKNVRLFNINYTFCSEKCWYNWLSAVQNIKPVSSKSPITSPLLEFNSPEYLEYYQYPHKISDIPPLFI